MNPQDEELSDVIQERFALLEAIEHYRQIAQKGSLIRLSLEDARIRNIPADRIRLMVIQFEFDEKAYSVLMIDSEDIGAFDSNRVVPIVFIREVFHRFFELLAEYRQKVQKLGPSNNSVDGANYPPFCTLTFDVLTRKLLLNGEYLISRPNLGSNNFDLIRFLSAHPNQDHTKAEIIKEIPELTGKPLAKCLDEMKIRGKLKLAFFQLTKSKIRFTPQQRTEDLLARGCGHLSDFRQFDDLIQNSPEPESAQSSYCYRRDIDTPISDDLKRMIDSLYPEPLMEADRAMAASGLIGFVKLLMDIDAEHKQQDAVAELHQKSMIKKHRN